MKKSAYKYRLYLESLRLAPNTINLRLTAIRRLAYQAADSGFRKCCQPPIALTASSPQPQASGIRYALKQMGVTPPPPATCSPIRGQMSRNPHITRFLKASTAIPYPIKRRGLIGGFLLGFRLRLGLCGRNFQFQQALEILQLALRLGGESTELQHVTDRLMSLARVLQPATSHNSPQDAFGS